MDDKQFLYLTIEVSENQTVEQVVKEVVDEIESYNWHVVAYDLNPHEFIRKQIFDDGIYGEGGIE